LFIHPPYCEFGAFHFAQAATLRWRRFNHRASLEPDARWRLMKRRVQILLQFATTPPCNVATCTVA
jgi:hypothetical protein